MTWLPPLLRSLRTYALAWLVLLAGCAITAAFGFALFRNAYEMDRGRFERQADQTLGIIRDRIERYELGLAGLADFAALKPRFTRAEWNFRVRLLQPQKNYPGLLELGVVECAALTESAKAPRAVENLQVIQSWVGEPSAFDGLNPSFTQEHEVREAIGLAISSNRLSSVHQRELSSEIAGKPAKGFTLFVPCGAVADERADKTGRPERVVFGSIQPGIMISSLFGTAPREIEFDLFSGEPSIASWVYGPRAAPALHVVSFNPYLRTTRTFARAGGEWTFVAYTTPLFEMESSRYRPWNVVGAGAALSVACAALLFFQIRARLKQETVAEELRLACVDLQRVQNERERLSRELHDGAIQSLYGLQLTLGRYERLLAKDKRAANELLAGARGLVDSLIAELRSFLVQHLPEEPGQAVLNSGVALQDLVRRFRSASNIAIELRVENDPPLTPGEILHLRQIAQEALSNSLRHSKAQHISIRLSQANGHVELDIRDDGVGFDVHAEQRRGQGLGNIQARAVQMGGQLKVSSSSGQGTLVSLRLPIGHK